MLEQGASALSWWPSAGWAWVWGEAAFPKRGGAGNLVKMRQPEQGEHPFLESRDNEQGVLKTGVQKGSHRDRIGEPSVSWVQCSEHGPWNT